MSERVIERGTTDMSTVGLKPAGRMAFSDNSTGVSGIVPVVLNAWHFRFKRFTGDVRKDGTPEFTVTEYTAVAASRDKALALAEASAANDNAGELLNDATAPIGKVRGEIETDGDGKPVRIAGKPRCEMHASYSRDQWEAANAGQ